MPKLGKKRITDISRKDIRKLFDDLTEGGAPVLANSVLASTGAVFQWALEREYVSANPCHGIARNKTNGSDRYLSDENIKLVWHEMEQHLNLHQTMALRLVLLLGQRPGETCAMRWQDVDLEAKVWVLPGAPADGWPGTKNGRTHEVPLSDAALTILKDELDPCESGSAARYRAGLLRTHAYPVFHGSAETGPPSVRPEAAATPVRGFGMA